MIGQSRSFAQANTGPRAVESDICTYLEWDSAFFDGRIARANCVRLDQSKVSELLDWCGNHHIDCLYFLADGDDTETARIAQQNDFREVDVRLTLDRPIHTEVRFPAAPDSRVRLARGAATGRSWRCGAAGCPAGPPGPGSICPEVKDLASCDCYA